MTIQNGSPWVLAHCNPRMQNDVTGERLRARDTFTFIRSDIKPRHSPISRQITSHKDSKHSVMQERMAQLTSELQAQSDESTACQSCGSGQARLGASRLLKAPQVPIEELQSILERLELNQLQSLSQCLDFTQRDQQLTCAAQQRVYWEPDQDGDNLLMTSVIHEREDIANYILSKATNHQCLNVRNKLGQTVLHLAVIMNMPTLVRRLIAWGAQVVTYDRHGNTPLHLACRDGRWECVVALTTPLTYEEVQERPYHVPYYRIPQEMELRNYDGLTCLHIAAMNVHFNIMDHLLRKCKANINSPDWKTGDTLFHFAIQTENLDLLHFLLRYRHVYVDAIRYDGATGLDLAKMTNNSKLVEVLLKAGAHSSLLDNGCQESLDLFTEYDDICINGVLI